MPVPILPTRENFRESAAVFELLSQLWARETDRAAMAALARPPLAAVWKSLGGVVSATPTDNDIEELAVDYCQLLIGPQGHVSPVQSVWDQKRFSGDATGSMQKYIDMLDGFDPGVKLIDHVAVQLQFAGVLSGLAAQSKRPLMQGLMKAFFRDHLEWTHDFFQRTEQQAKTGFYRGLSIVSRQFLFGD